MFWGVQISSEEVLWIFSDSKLGDTVDGTNAPVDMVNIPLFTCFFTSQVVCRISSLNRIITRVSDEQTLPAEIIQRILSKETSPDTWEVRPWKQDGSR